MMSCAHLLSLALAFAAAPEQAGDARSLDSLESLVAREFAPYRSGGTVLVAKHGKAILRRSYGLANLELDVAMQPGHLFKIGSITKQFTAFATLRLVQEGWDSPSFVDT